MTISTTITTITKSIILEMLVDCYWYKSIDQWACKCKEENMKAYINESIVNLLL